jgi:cell division transport system ATP-binding protein
MANDPIISYTDVAVFQKETLVLSNVTFNVEEGEFVYLIGKTGSGKSSLLKTLYGEIPVEQGEASVVGYDLKKLRSKEVPYLRRKLGIIFQDFQLLSDRSVEANLLFVLKATGTSNLHDAMLRIKAVLAKVGLATKGFKLPHQLSGGEQQRVAIARALLNDPEIILADEPTGNLDPDTSRGIMNLLHEISSSGRAVLMATHNYLLIREFPGRMLKCEDGKVLALENQFDEPFTIG